MSMTGGGASVGGALDFRPGSGATGGQLALYDVQVKTLSRAVIQEARKLRRAA